VSLSERLAEAAAARADGTDVARPRSRPERDQVDAGPAEVGGAAVDPGVPAPCPDCGGAGYLERIDLSARRQHERCRACGARWSRPV